MRSLNLLFCGGRIDEAYIKEALIFETKERGNTLCHSHLASITLGFAICIYAIKKRNEAMLKLFIKLKSCVPEIRKVITRDEEASSSNPSLTYVLSNPNSSQHGFELSGSQENRLLRPYKFKVKVKVDKVKGIS